MFILGMTKITEFSQSSQRRFLPFINVKANPKIPMSICNSYTIYTHTTIGSRQKQRYKSVHYQLWCIPSWSCTRYIVFV